MTLETQTTQLQEEAVAEAHAEVPRRKTSPWRWVLLIGVLVGLFVLARAMGWQEYMQPQRLRKLIEGAGFVGVIMYLGIFAFGELVHIPGLVFVAAGVYAYGQLMGGALALAGAILSVTVSFWVVRIVGGQALSEIRWSILKKMLERLDERPITIVIVLRLMFFIAPPVNYALALSTIRFRDYLIGSAIGLTPVLVFSVLFFDWLFK
ncbi:MAG: TVP38/TMEM64 family protein [Deltaproteobacteria bacterium]|nr:MAG: TVP38/TMEM64 family protein [Deltaproteobacteria bacterium]